MDLIALQRRVHQSWTDQRWHEWLHSCADDYRFQLTPTVHLGVEHTLTWSRAWFEAFPDYREQVRAVYSSDDAVAYELIGTGSSEADLTFLGQTLARHSPGAHFELHYAKVLVFNSDRKVTDDRQYLDPASLRDQLT
ncbi:ester cyclase [Williamsia sterculiae]|uniref:SnoaL-like polyketide cyclase n=1 Tax=Williamsia sterculiae TaxID=1344003 RepID=A0A1N7FV55_9NOCA|nr:ester cyclase [Williamsia sterculiae]SIS04179.1 SnoaL-like polyketide cyclase [Williamsia sterculiae]